MNVPLDVRCLECGLIFCCESCRKKHESNVHQLLYECRLCRLDLFSLDPTAPQCLPLLDHISTCHLPLHCVKCNKLYERMEDVMQQEPCKTKNEAEAKSTEMGAPAPVECVRILKKKFEFAKCDDKAVMTSTPTHPSFPNWVEFQKSFTSTLSGIHSPDSDGPHHDDDKNTLSNQLSSIHADSTSNPKVQDIKGIVKKSSVESADSCEKPHEQSSAEKAEGEGVPQEFTPSINNSSDKRKRVTFADDKSRDTMTVKPHVFVKPKRNPTPAKPKPKRSRTPRFQAIINNFESRTSKVITTPKNVRVPLSGEETPPSTEQNVNGIMARTINFKQESPTTSEDLNNSPKQAENSPGLESIVMSPTEGEITNLDQYKSCINDSPVEQSGAIVDTRQMESVEDLPKQIANSIQGTLCSALNSEDFSTEIQFKIVITKKVVSIKETTKCIDEMPHKNYSENQARIRKKESTTIWSRLVDGVKWVIWGDKDIDIGDENKIPEQLMLSSGKRKRYYPDLNESPIRNKRYRYSGRINGRRPLDRVLKGTSLMERSNSIGAEISKENDDSAEKSGSLNRSF